MSTARDPATVDAETYSDSEQIACPWCGEQNRDLWDYEWGSREVIEIACGHCDKPITIARCVSVSYRARPILEDK
jgi:hypothetical protein